MAVNIRPEKYLKYLYLPNLFGTQRTKEILSVNPTIIPHREEATEVVITLYDYNNSSLNVKKLTSIKDCFPYKSSSTISWINIDGLRKAEVEEICNHFAIHPLVVEDILSI